MRPTIYIRKCSVEDEIPHAFPTSKSCQLRTHIGSYYALEDVLPMLQRPPPDCPRVVKHHTAAICWKHARASAATCRVISAGRSCNASQKEHLWEAYSCSNTTTTCCCRSCAASITIARGLLRHRRKCCTAHRAHRHRLAYGKHTTYFVKNRSYEFVLVLLFQKLQKENAKKKITPNKKEDHPREGIISTPAVPASQSGFIGAYSFTIPRYFSSLPHQRVVAPRCVA